MSTLAGGPNSLVISGALMPSAIRPHMNMNTSWPSHMNDSRPNEPSGSVPPGMSPEA